MVTVDLREDPAPTISVVVPLYNKAGHVRRALDSVLRQTRQDFEIVVVDDGSTDEGAAIVRAIDDPRIRLVGQANSGVSVARNTGIAAARAELIAFLDADDAYRPDFLANILDLRRRYPSAGAFAMNYEVIDPQGRRSLGVAVATEAKMSIDLDAFLRIGKFGSPVFSSSVAVPKASFLRAGTFPPGVKLGEDIDTWLRICFVAPIAFDRRPGGCYYQDAEHRAVVRNPPPERYRFFDTLDRWFAEHPQSPRALRDEAEEFMNSFIISFARHQIRFGRSREGRRALLRCRTRTFALVRLKWLAASFFPQQWQGKMASLRAALRSQ